MIKIVPFIVKKQAYIAIGVSVFVVMLSLFKPQLVERLQLIVFDSYQQISPRESADFPIYVVDVDEATLASEGQWPWPRGRLAHLLTEINQFNPAVIGLDVLLSEEDRFSEDDIFSQKTANIPLVLGFAALYDGPLNEPLSKHSVANIGSLGKNIIPRYASSVHALDAFQRVAAGNGALNMALDIDGILRSVPLVLSIKTEDGYNTYPSFSLELLRVLQGARTIQVKAQNEGVNSVKVGNFVVKSHQDGSVRLHYSKQIRQPISANKLLNKQGDYSDLEGAIIIVGSSALGLKDIVTTPLSSGIAGYSIHVQLLEQILQGISIERPDWITGFERFIMILSLLGVFFAVVRFKPLTAFTVSAVMTVSLYALGLVAFTYFELLFDPIYIVVSILVLFPIQSAYKHYINEKKLIESMSELRLASEVQAATWPKIIPKFNGLDADGWSIPADDTGGDTFDFFTLNKQLIFSLGDATGHGISASLHAVMIRSMIRSGMRLGNDASATLFEVNNQLNQDTINGRFVTFFMGILNENTFELSLYSAGQGPILYYQKASNNIFSLNPKAPPLGVLSGVDFPQLNKAILAPGDALIVCSDGIPEAKNAKGELFGDERLNNLIKNEIVNGCQVLSKVLKKALNQFCGDTPADDDRTLVMIKREED